jgi:myo-inositol-1(or 4)-monophosphatase
VPEVRDIRRVGAAAVDLAWIARGRADVHYECGLNPWDWGAGALLVEEAGGVARGLGAQPPSRELLMAGPRGLVDALEQKLLSLGIANCLDGPLS